MLQDLIRRTRLTIRNSLVDLHVLSDRRLIGLVKEKHLLRAQFLTKLSNDVEKQDPSHCSSKSPDPCQLRPDHPLGQNERARDQAKKSKDEVTEEKERPRVGVGSIDAMNRRFPLLFLETQVQSRRPEMPIPLRNPETEKIWELLDFKLLLDRGNCIAKNLLHLLGTSLHDLGKSRANMKAAHDIVRMPENRSKSQFTGNTNPPGTFSIDP